MSHNHAKGHTPSEKNTWRKNRDFHDLQTKLGPFQDHPHPPKVNILKKAILAPLTLHREVYHLSLTTLHLT